MSRCIVHLTDAVVFSGALRVRALQRSFSKQTRSDELYGEQRGTHAAGISADGCLSARVSVCACADGACAAQVIQSQEKISRLEQEKEHWLLEAQLGQVRLQKEIQRIAQLEAQVADGRIAETHGAADGPEPTCADAPEPVQDSSVVSETQTHVQMVNQRDGNGSLMG